MLDFVGLLAIQVLFVVAAGSTRRARAASIAGAA